MVNDTLSEIISTAMCVRAQTTARGTAIHLDYLKSRESQARESKVEITNSLYAEKDPQPPLSLIEFQAAEGDFRQPTAAEVSILSFWKLRYARSREQELSNEFARLLNRGSPLE